MFRENFGYICKVVRKKKNLSQEELANRLEIATSTISRIENGSVPHKKTMAKIIKELGEEFFYENPSAGLRTENYRKRKNLEGSFLNHIQSGRLDKAADAISDYKGVIRQDSNQDLQSFMAMQQMWLQSKYKKQMDESFSDKYMDIYNMSQENKSKVSEQDIHLEGVQLTYMEQIILNNMGLSFINEGKMDVAERIFREMFVMMLEKADEDPVYYKRLAIICNNQAIVYLRQGDTNRAKMFCNYAIAHGLKELNTQTFIKILKTKYLILKSENRITEADELNNFLEVIASKSETYSFKYIFDDDGDADGVGISVL